MAGQLALPETFEAIRAAMLRTTSDERRWQLIKRLATWPKQARETALELLHSRGIAQRMGGIELAGALCFFQPRYIGQLAPELVAAFDRETDDDLLTFTFYSLHQAAAHEGERAPARVDGRWRPARPLERRRRVDPPAVWQLLTSERLERLATLAACANPARRAELVVALADFMGHDRQVLDLLLQLSADGDANVRKQATYELAITMPKRDLPEANEPYILDALWERVFDPEAIIRNQVALGFVLRGDPRSAGILATQLRQDEATVVLAEAAERLADPTLAPAIETILSWWPPAKARPWRRALIACGGGRAPRTARAGHATRAR